jgi:hypothetical protein
LFVWIQSPHTDLFGFVSHTALFLFKNNQQLYS